MPPRHERDRLDTNTAATPQVTRPYQEVHTLKPVRDVHALKPVRDVHAPKPARVGAARGWDRAGSVAGAVGFLGAFGFDGLRIVDAQRAHLGPADEDDRCDDETDPGPE